MKSKQITLTYWLQSGAVILMIVAIALANLSINREVWLLLAFNVALFGINFVLFVTQGRIRSRLQGRDNFGHE